jgi:hypothetical protein
MNSRERSRRSFLKAVGAAAAALPFFKLLERSAVDAQAGDLPLNLVGIYHGHGRSKPFWHRKPGETDTSFDIAYPNCSLAPLDDPATYGASFKDRVLILEGLNYACAIESGTPGHWATGCILTGSNTVIDENGENAKPLNASLDYYLAQERGLGAQTVISNVVMGVGNFATGGGCQISYAPGGAPLTKLLDPVQTFELFFANLVGMDDPVAQAEAERKRKLGHSIIDFIRGDISRLNPRLAPEERKKLDQHLTSIREIEKRLDGLSPSGCVIPARPQPTGNPDPADDFPQIYANNGGEPYFERIADLQLDMLAQALACGLTRFASFWLADIGRAVPDLEVPLPENWHDEVAHAYSESDVTSAIRLSQASRYHYGKLARFMQRLHATGTLDSTLIVMASELGDPAGHGVEDVPIVLAGGANNYFKMGRRLVYNGDPHNRLLVSIANAFGDEIDSFGTTTDPAIAEGTLPGLR